MQYSSLFTMLAAASGTLAAISFNPASIALHDSVLNSAAGSVFQSAPAVGLLSGSKSRVRRAEVEPSPDRNVTLEDGLIFVLQCTTAGFRDNCLSFGAPPGRCVSYFDFQAEGDTSVSDMYNDQVSSLSTNTGGICQFYHFLGCDNKGDDRGLSSSYNYDLSVALESDPRTVLYNKNITSWRC